MEDQQIQQFPAQVETDEQEVGGKRKCCFKILKVRFTPVAFYKDIGLSNAVEESNLKTNFKLVNRVLKEISKIAWIVGIIPDIGLFIFFAANFIHSIINFATRQEPLVYNIICIIISFVSLGVNCFKLLYRSCRYYIVQKAKKRKDSYQVEHEHNKENPIQKKDENICYVGDKSTNNGVLWEKLNSHSIKVIKKLAFKLLPEFFLYPAIICSLYALVNEKSWQFDDFLGGYTFCHFVYNTVMDAFYTKIIYVVLVLKVIKSLHYDPNNALKINCKSLVVTLNVGLLVLAHWLILAIIGVRIHVDNFTREIDQGNESEADLGGYKVAPYTGYMIFCGAYLPVASVIVHLVLNRAWLLDEIDSTTEELLFFVSDPISYIVTPFLMGPFIAFCVGIFLPDFDSSEVDIDFRAEISAKWLGAGFIVVFILGNINATVVFGILLILITFIVIIIAIILAIIAIIIGTILTFIVLVVGGSVEMVIPILICLWLCKCMNDG